VASATPSHSPFSDTTFQEFARFVQENFSSRISLATVLVVLFTTTSNPDLLNLHARQQNPLPGEAAQVISGWTKALGRALEERLGNDADRLFKKSEQKPVMNVNQVQSGIGMKLDLLSKLLKLYPYDALGQSQHSLKPVSEKDTEPVYVICPASMECQTVSCNRRSIRLDTRDRDVPRVTLIKGTKIHDGVHVLSGKCTTCDTKYYADHESSQHNGAQGVDERTRFYLNSAKYLKVGQKIWVDRVFSEAVVNATYSFHASSATFAEFWNDSFWSTQGPNTRKISRRQIWHTFVQESIRKVAKASGQSLELPDELPISEVTKHAFISLGEGGVIRSAEDHFCSECTHNYKQTADRITGDDPAAVIGVDENRQVPVLTGENADLAVQDAAQARFNAESAMDIDQSPSPSEDTPVKLVVLDGVVMGPTHCAYEDCTQDLAQVRKGVFCVQHEILRGNLCHMHNCDNIKVPPSQTCTEHQNNWYRHAVRYGCQTLLGIRRIVRRSEEEQVAWLPTFNRHTQQQHDEAAVTEN
jgi:CxC5 like cysteine cluster associated with KDZ transposases/CxC6 like cysteine cluster associated with KDZ transposases